MKENNICLSCKWCYQDVVKCHRLVFTCLGMRDKLGEDFKRNNACLYYEKGERRGVYKPLNLYNS